MEFSQELLTVVQGRIGQRAQEILEAQQTVPQDDYTVVAMGTLVLNRLMLHLINLEEQDRAAADANARAESIISALEAQKAAGKENRFEL